MASFFEHIGSEVESAADESALASAQAAEAAKVAAEAARDSAASSASDASNSEATVTSSQNAAAASATASAASAATSTTKALECAASEATSTTKASESAASAATATTKATEASASATTATTKAAEATSARDDITGLTASTGAAGSSASYNSSTGVLSVPRGDTGAQGVQGIQGPAGQDSTVAGPQGPAGQDSTVAGPQGPAGQDSTVAGPQGIQGVQGPQGVAGADGTQFDTNVLKVDATNNRVGVNDTTPSVSLDAGSNTDAIAVPVGTTAQRPADGAGRFRYNSTTQAFEGYTTEWGSIAGGGGTNTFTTDSFTANGSTTAYALSQVTSSEDSLLVFIDGVFQTQDAYAIATASGTTTLTFSAAPANSRKIVVYSVAAAVSGSNLNIDSMTGDGSDVTLTLSIAPVNVNNTIVTIDGVYQSKSNYSISGTTLTFSTAPPTGTAVEVMTFTQTEINVPVDGTITSAKLSGALTTPSDLTVTGTSQITRLGLGVAAHASAALQITTTDQHIRLNNGSELGVIDLDSDGKLNIWAHGDGETINLKTGSGAGTDVLSVVGNNVGIGTSPSHVLHVDASSTSTLVTIHNTNGSSSDCRGLDVETSTTGTTVQRWLNAGSELGRFTATGNLLVGGTQSNPTGANVAGASIDASGEGNFSVDGAEALRVNRLTSDGAIVQFMKAGQFVGAINATSGDLAIGTGDCGIRFNDGANAVIPFNITTNAQVDNTLDLGYPTLKWNDAYITNGVTTGSDRNQKQDIETLSDAEQRVAVACKSLLRKWRWIDAVDAKGDDARIHFGIIAQDLQDAFTAEGLDAGRYAMFMSNTWWETQTEVAAVEATEDTEAVDAHTRTDTYDTAEEAPEGATERTRLGVRYNELLAFIIAAI